MLDALLLFVVIPGFVLVLKNVFTSDTPKGHEFFFEGEYEPECKKTVKRWND